MIDQTILHLIVKCSLLYFIRNRNYSRLKNVPEQENYQFRVELTEETKHIENKSLNTEFLRYTLFFILVLWQALWLAVYQINHSPIQYSGRLLH